MPANNKPQTLVRMVMPNAAIVQAVLTDMPASLTLRTPFGAMQVEVGQKFSDDRNRLTKARRGVQL